jgi:N-acetylmuramoyl-L-alanine amidase
VAASLLALIVGGGCRRQSNRALDPTNELPFGHVDMPTDGQHVGSETSVAGWAMDDRGIREIRVYVDGHFVNVAQLAVDRPDVSKVFPQYARGSHQHGWGVSVQFQGADVHKIVVQAVDSDGATRDIGVLDVTSGG